MNYCRICGCALGEGMICSCCEPTEQRIQLRARIDEIDLTIDVLEEKRRLLFKQLYQMGKCEDPKCSVSTGIHEGPTFGKGDLDPNGYWEEPCEVCARNHDEFFPEALSWPFKEEDRKKLEEALNRKKDDQDSL